MAQIPETQAIESSLLNEWETKFFPIFHNYIHRCSKPWARNSSSVRRNQLSILAPEDPSGMVWYQITNAMSDLVAYIDGGSFGNPGPSGIGVVISGAADGTIGIARWIGQQDNNVAEYVALLEALQCAPGAQSQGAARVFRLRSNGQADDWRIQLPQPAALFLALDLPEIGRNARFLDLPRSSREQH
jgi:hypothetical protein